MALTKEQIKELEVQHGEVAHCKEKRGRWEVVFRKPTLTEYKLYRQQLHGARKSDAQEALSTACVVHPSREAYCALLESWPAIPEICADAIGALLGTTLEEESK